MLRLVRLGMCPALVPLGGVNLMGPKGIEGGVGCFSRDSGVEGLEGSGCWPLTE